MDTKQFRSIVMAILVMALVGMSFLGSPTPTLAASPSKNVVADSTTPPPVIKAPESNPEMGVGANIMQAANWRGTLLAQFRLTNNTPDARTVGICIEANGVGDCKSASAPANSGTVQVRWDYWTKFKLTWGVEYNLMYTITVAGLPPIYGQRNLTTSELPQIGLDVATRVCSVSALAAFNLRPRDDPGITATLAGGTVIWAGHLPQDVWSGWISVPSSATGGPVSVTINATEPGRAASRDVVFVETCEPPPCYKLGDRVWNDVNVDGLQTAGEPGVGGVTVTVTSQIGTMTTTTDANGNYLFPKLCDGSYIVKFYPPPEFVFTVPNVQSNTLDTLDSDPVAGQVTVNLTSDNLTIDAGLISFDVASVTCFCVEIRGGINVVRWTLSETANARYAIYRGPSDKLRDAVQLEAPALWNPAQGEGSHEWPDVYGTATDFYWLFEDDGTGRVNSYGPIRASATVCQSFIPMVRR